MDDYILWKDKFVLKLPHFFTRKYSDWKSGKFKTYLFFYQIRCSFYISFGLKKNDSVLSKKIISNNRVKGNTDSNDSWNGLFLLFLTFLNPSTCGLVYFTRHVDMTRINYLWELKKTYSQKLNNSQRDNGKLKHCCFLDYFEFLTSCADNWNQMVRLTSLTNQDYTKNAKWRR